MKQFYLIGLLLLALQVKASHVSGADITYTYKGNQIYHVVFNVYRECSGTPLQSVQFFVSKGDGSAAVSISPVRTNIKDISVVCKNDTLPCQPKNTTTNAGVECHTYEQDIDLKQSTYSALLNNNCQVLFSVSICCRDGAITTLTPDNLYLESMVDVCLTASTGNQSPRFSFMPIKNMCCNTYFNYNVAATEYADFDSISFQLVPALKAFGDSVRYNGNYWSKIPMAPYCPPTPGLINCKALPSAKPPRGFYFNSFSGDIVFTPNKCDEVGVVVIQVDEWRKDSTGALRRVGYIKRESTWFVTACSSNNAPNLTGNNQYSVCEGNKICFNVSSFDDVFLPMQTVADTIQLSWDSSIKAATFRIIDPNAREKQAEFCWQTKLGDAKTAPYRFSVIADDQHCSPPLKSFKTYTIQVKPKAQDQLSYQYLLKGGLVIVASPSNTTAQSSYRYMNSVYNDSMKLIHYALNKTHDTLVFTKAGTYIIEHQVNQVPYNCPSLYFDTIIITQAHLTNIQKLFDHNIEISPNPSTGKIQVHLDHSDVQELSYSIYNSFGQLIQSGTINRKHPWIDQLPKGQLILQLKARDWIEQKQIIVAY